MLNGGGLFLYSNVEYVTFLQFSNLSEKESG